MDKKIIKKIFGLVLLMTGAIFLVNARMNMTGAFFGLNDTTSFSFFVGAILLILGVIIFSTASLYPLRTSLEQRVIPNSISSSIKQTPSLLRLTEDAVRDEAVEREMNHLIKELSKGNFEAGLGHPGHIEGTKVHYLRGRNGARLYYQKKGEKTYEIVAKSAKGRNQEQVIDKLKEIY